MIRLVWGDGVGPTEKAAFDAALADAGLHQYNLRRLSSVIPADVTVESTGTAPELGPTGNVLDVVLAEQVSHRGPGRRGTRLGSRRRRRRLLRGRRYRPGDCR
jgi:arginine decarboxylase (EC 4.1.1.19)